MARPPIIISNGSVIAVLGTGLQPVPGNNKTLEQQLNENVKTLKTTSVVMIIKNKGQSDKAPCLYWRLKVNDDKYEDKFPTGPKQGKEGASINEVVDETD